MRPARRAPGDWMRLTRENAIEGGRQRLERNGDALDVSRRETVGGCVAGRYRFEELTDGDREGARQAHENVSARIGLRQFDPPNVLVVQPCELGELFLR